MPVAKLKQKAELRVVVADSDRYAVVLRATLRDENLYTGVQKEPEGEFLSSSYHQSGMGHIKLQGDRRVRYPPGVPLRDFRGREQFWGAGADLTSLDWNYKPKRDTRVRRTFILEMSSLPDLWSVDLWAIEKGRSDLVQETLADYGVGTMKKNVLGHALIAGTQPQLLAVAWTPSKEILESLHHYIAENLPPGGKVTQMIGGGGPPILMPIQKRTKRKP